MKKSLVSFTLALALVLLLSTAAFAQSSQPIAACANGWELMSISDMGGMMDMPMHLGLAQDLNGDGYLCVLKISDTQHVHMDNTVPFQP